MRVFCRGLLVSGMFVLGFMLITCANIPNVDPATVLNQFFGNNVPLDSDMDGLTDEEELVYGTSPFIQDTDGDGFNDWKEVVNFAFSPDVNPYAFNPLVADLRITV